MTDPTTLEKQLSAAITTSLPDLPGRLDSEPQAHLDLIRQTAAAQRTVEALLQSSVLAARSAGHSWETIGSTLGMTRQAAQQRFGKSAPPSDTGAWPPGETHRLSPLTAFDEMEILNRAGRYGWHSVGFGTLYHLITRDTQQWEHRRVLAFDPGRGALEAQGWGRVGTLWFPWAYYTRPTGLAALPAPAAGLDFFHLPDPPASRRDDR
ncbi:hypothetical protein [Deinococcus aerophilus]|uniref:Uncharacterized protein n=1 Tax=Deinococcus aerophilus TaxID=522488 RepID=A0ABQ2GWB9_9DEIO|nr:hypothetical protein [Deinococcus aerophilus]GGM16879.1 hypothetical protein GCM10010841_26480 [Deinococcus aerophilus]